MSEFSFVAILAILTSLYFAWGFRALPREDWQIMASVPRRKHAGGHWHALNLTWYGILMANACVFAVTLLLVLLASIGIPVSVTVLMATVAMAICVPAARLVATMIEKKKYTFTVAGAFFVGVFVMPAIVLIADRLLGPRLGIRIPLVPVLSATVICFSFGEAVGRLACISFGCCYGKPAAQSMRLMRLLAGWSFVFSGPAKKASYEGGLEGAPLVPIQGITAIVLTLIGLAGTTLFLSGYTGVALVVTLLLTQLWRFASEFYRADFRGANRGLSAYQIMALAGVLFAVAVAFAYRTTPVPAADLQRGLSAVWNPIPILFIQFTWLAIFLFAGRSDVTDGTVTFEVNRERI